MNKKTVSRNIIFTYIPWHYTKTTKFSDRWN